MQIRGSASREQLRRESDAVETAVSTSSDASAYARRDCDDRDYRSPRTGKRSDSPLRQQPTGMAAQSSIPYADKRSGSGWSTSPHQPSAEALTRTPGSSRGNARESGWSPSPQKDRAYGRDRSPSLREGGSKSFGYPNDRAYGRGGSPSLRDGGSKSSGHSKDSTYGRKGSPNLRESGSKSSGYRVDRYGRPDSPPAKSLKRKSSPNADDGQKLTKGFETRSQASGVNATFEDEGNGHASGKHTGGWKHTPAGWASRSEKDTSEVERSHMDSVAHTGSYRVPDSSRSRAGPSTGMHAAQFDDSSAADTQATKLAFSLVNKTCKWPFEEDASCPKRIRRSQRPVLGSLRNRRFRGCSSIDQYMVGVKLGQGTFGEVKKATHLVTGEEVALKKVTVHEEKDGMPITAIREVKLLKRLHHPSIVPVIDMAYRAPTQAGKCGEIFMVEPYMDHDLNGMLMNPSIQLNTSQIKLYMKQLFEGTLYMHQNKILHRDMKAANLLINNKGQLQIADFGLARPYHDPGVAWESEGWKGGSRSYTGMVVTRWYRPPELLAGERKYGPPIDMWGLGCIVAEMIAKRPVFNGSSEVDQMHLISKLCGSPTEQSYPGWKDLPGVKNADPNGRPDPEPDVPGQHDFGSYPRQVVDHFTGPKYMASGDLADLIDKLLVLDPRRRLTAKQALEHRWFWTAPFPADPNSMPTYQASKEQDRQMRRDLPKRPIEQTHRQQQPPPSLRPTPQPPSAASGGGSAMSNGMYGPTGGGGGSGFRPRPTPMMGPGYGGDRRSQHPFVGSAAGGGGGGYPGQGQMRPSYTHGRGGGGMGSFASQGGHRLPSSSSHLSGGAGEYRGPSQPPRPSSRIPLPRPYGARTAPQAYDYEGGPPHHRPGVPRRSYPPPPSSQSSAFNPYL